MSFMLRGVHFARVHVHFIVLVVDVVLSYTCPQVLLSFFILYLHRFRSQFSAMGSLLFTLNVLGELGCKELFLKHQHNIRTKSIVGTDSENFPSFSASEPLRLLLDAFVVNDEKETLLSSIPRNRKKNISLEQMSIQFLLSNGSDSWRRANTFSSLCFCFCLRSACRICRIQF